MNHANLIRKIEGVVKQRTPQYVSLSNPGFDEKLLKAQYLLAKLYAREGNDSRAHTHFRNAEYEFFNMCRTETRQPQYISGGLEGFRKFREQEKKTERRLENYKRKLLDVAHAINYDATHLLLTPTNASNKKEDLVKIVQELV